MKTLLLSVLMLTPSVAPPQAPMTARIVCPDCGGSGVVDNGSVSPYESHWSTCPTCHGRQYIEGLPARTGSSRPPQAPAVEEQIRCYCPRDESYCVCDPGKCVCDSGRPCPANKPAPPVLAHQAALIAEPKYQFLILSRTACVPCANLKAELKANGSDLNWDIFTNRPDLDAKHNITAYPTILLLRDGQEVSRHVGYLSAADLLRWVSDPDAPQSRGEAVEKAAPVVYSQPTYRPMRYAAACAGSS